MAASLNGLGVDRVSVRGGDPFHDGGAGRRLRGLTAWSGGVPRPRYEAAADPLADATVDELGGASLRAASPSPSTRTAGQDQQSSPAAEAYDLHDTQRRHRRPLSSEHTATGLRTGGPSRKSEMTGGPGGLWSPPPPTAALVVVAGVLVLNCPGCPSRPGSLILLGPLALSFLSLPSLKSQHRR